MKFNFGKTAQDVMDDVDRLTAELLEGTEARIDAAWNEILEQREESL